MLAKKRKNSKKNFKMIDASGSILIFAGVGFSALSVCISFAGKELSRITADIMREPKDETQMVVEGKIRDQGILDETTNQVIYSAAEYISNKTVYFFFISSLYLLGALSNLFYLVLSTEQHLSNSPYSSFYVASISLIMLATFLSLLIIGGVTKNIFEKFLFKKKIVEWSELMK